MSLPLLRGAGSGGGGLRPLPFFFAMAAAKLGGTNPRNCRPSWTIWWQAPMLVPTTADRDL